MGGYFVDNQSIKNICSKKRFTNDSYLEVLKNLKKYKIKKEVFERFIENGILSNEFSVDDRYEKAYVLKGMSNIDFAQLINIFMKRNSSSQRAQIPWDLFTSVFVSKHGDAFDNLKKQYSLKKQQKGIAREMLKFEEKYDDIMSE